MGPASSKFRQSPSGTTSSASSRPSDKMGPKSSKMRGASSQHPASSSPSESEPAPAGAVTAFGHVLFDKCISFAERLLSHGLLESSALCAILEGQSAEGLVCLLLRCVTFHTMLLVSHHLTVCWEYVRKAEFHATRHAVCCMPRAMLSYSLFAAWSRWIWPCRLRGYCRTAPALRLEPPGTLRRWRSFRAHGCPSETAPASSCLPLARWWL
jgi:hypothetical protein